MPRSRIRRRRRETIRLTGSSAELTGLRVRRQPNTYLLLVSYRSKDPKLASDVANAVASSYIQQTYLTRYHAAESLSGFMQKQLEELKAKMERSNAALVAFQRELNVINPEEKTNIIQARLLDLNSEYTKAQADRVQKETAFRSTRDGSLESVQVSTQGESLKGLAQRLDEAQEKFAEIKVHYGVNHPEYRRAAAQIAQLQSQIDAARLNVARRVEIEYQEAINREEMLKSSVAQAKAEMNAVSARSFEYESLKREADADKKLYEELTTRIKEAGINAGFQNSAIRIADPARPAAHPVSPRPVLNGFLALVLSSLVAVGACILVERTDRRVRDPQQASALGMEVLGTLPSVSSVAPFEAGNTAGRDSGGRDRPGGGSLHRNCAAGSAVPGRRGFRRSHSGFAQLRLPFRPREAGGFPHGFERLSPGREDHHRDTLCRRERAAEAAHALDRCRPAVPRRRPPGAGAA